MKKAITILVVLFTSWSFQLKAQSNCVTVVNNTSCDANFQFIGSDSFCMVSGISSMMMIGAGSTASFPNPAIIPGLPPSTVYIVGATVFTAPITCAAFSSLLLGEPCTGAPTAVSYFPYTITCTPCSASATTTVWNSAPGGCASLTFN